MDNKIFKFLILGFLSTLIISGCSNSSDKRKEEDPEPPTPVDTTLWTHFSQKMPGEIPEEKNGVREFYIDDKGNYQFDRPTTGKIEHSDDVNFSTFIDNDPRYIIPLTKPDDEFNSLLIDLSNNNIISNEVEGFSNDYVNIDNLPSIAGTKKDIMFKHKTNSDKNPYLLASTLTCTKVFTSWDNLKTTFGGSEAFSEFVNLGPNVYVDGYYALANDIEVEDNVKYAGVDFKTTQYDRGFRGIFDGRNHKIIESKNSCSGGLFGSIMGGTIKNLTIDDIKLVDDELGALACQSYNATFSKLTLNFSSIKDTNSGAGIVVSKFLDKTIFSDITIDAKDCDINSVFGGYFKQTNIFKNVIVNALSVKNWGTTDSNTTAIQKPNNITLNITTKEIILDLDPQEIVLKSSSIQSLNLGKDYSSITACDSIDLIINEESFSLGKNVKTLLIPNNLKNSSYYGDAIVKVKSANLVLILKVTIITKIIRTIEDLESLAIFSDSTQSTKGYFLLDEDLELGSYSKETANSSISNYSFEGILDGNNHKISVDINSTKNGLFGIIRNASIKNLTINATIYEGNSCFLANEITNSTIQNVNLIISSSITTTRGDALDIICNGQTSENVFSLIRFTSSCPIISLFNSDNKNDKFSDFTIVVPSLDRFSSSLILPPEGCSLIKTQTIENRVIIENRKSTYTIPLQVAGTIKSVSLNSQYLGTSLTINTSIFDGNTGDLGEITVTYLKDEVLYKTIFPVFVVTMVITTVNEVKNFLSVADGISGTVGDGYYDGYFVLNNDITWDGTNYSEEMPEITKNVNQVGKGFNGTFDGLGHSIINFKVSSPNQGSGLIPRLGTYGVLKNIGFIDVVATNCTIAAAWGEGIVENIYVSYKEGITHGATFAVVNLYSTSYCNIVMKNSLVDARNDFAGSRRALGNGPKYNKLNYNNVFVLTKSETTPVIELEGNAEQNLTGSQPCIYPLSYNTYSAYTNYADLLCYGGDEINNWEYFSYKNDELRFGDKILTNSSLSQITKNHKFIDDYTIVYDKDNIDSIKAAYLIELELYKASADLITYTELTNNERSQLNITGGKNIRKVAYTPYTSNKNLIVIGNRELADEAGIQYENNRIVKKDNSVFIISKNNYDCLAAGYEFLKEVIGYKILGQDFIVFNNIPEVLPDINIEFTVAVPYRLLTNRITEYFYEQMGINLAYSGYLFDDGPRKNGDPNNQKELIHNDLDWIPPSKYQSSHQKWFRSWNNLDLCWTAHGDATEYEALVSTLANNMYEVLSTNKEAKRISFGMEDINYTHCECDTCCQVEQQYGSYSYQGIKLLNDVTSKIENMPGMNGREFYVYLLCYYFTTKAPTNIKIGDHVGITYAPLRYDYGKPKSSTNSESNNPIKPEQAKLIHDPNSVGNKFVKDNFIAWAKLFSEKTTGKTEYGCWFYDMYFNNYMSIMDTYEVNISLCEFVANETNGNIRFVYIQGQTSVVNGTGFETFKQFINSRALIEAKDKVKSFKDCTSYSDYQISVSKYLRELENEFFGISYRNQDLRFVPSTSGNYDNDILPYRKDCVFNDKGYYGNASANNSMYTLYLFERNECAWALENGKVSPNIGDRWYLSTSAYASFTTSNNLDFHNYLSQGSGTLKTYYRYTQLRLSSIRSMLTCYFEALKNVNNCTSDVKNLCVRHIKYEGLCPLFFAIMCNSTNDSYGFAKSGFTYDDHTYSYSELKTMFKTIATSQGINYICEGTQMSIFITKFGF